MAKKLRFLSLLMLLLPIIATCSPQPTPTPAPILPPASLQPLAAPSTLAVRPEDAAWAKVLEAAKKEGMLTIYSTYFVADIGRALAEAFRDKYGIRVEILAASGRASVDRVKVERQIGKPIADIINSGGNSAAELVVSGFAKGVSQDLPILRDKSIFVIDPLYSPGGELLSTTVAMSTITINTNLVKPQEEPKSYYDLLDPKWKGKIITTAPRGGASDGFNFWSTFTYYKVLDDDYFRKLAPQLTLSGASATEQDKLVARGEYHLRLSGTDAQLMYLIIEGAPVKQLVMEEGTIVGGGWQVTKVVGAPHPNATRLFLNWLLSPEGQEIYAKVAGIVTNIRKDVPSYVSPAVKAAIPTPKKILNRGWDVEEAGNRGFKAGRIDEIFGRK